MALEQRPVSSTGNLFLCVQKNPLTKSQIPTLHFSSHRRPGVSQLRLNRSIKCSVEYKDHHNQEVEHAKPAEIPWNKELCNTVHLIGTVGVPVEMKQLPSGTFIAWTRIGVKKSATETSWVRLTFWDELAQVAFQHVEKGDQVYVSGQLVSDTVENEDGKQQTFFKVFVRQLNFVERSSTSLATYDRDSNVMTAGRKRSNNAGNDVGSTEELWKAFFANPLEWWDNRTNKRNPKYPDFKHKDTGEALWVDSMYNPPWLKSQLAILDERMGSLQGQYDRMRVSSMIGDDLVPF